MDRAKRTKPADHKIEMWVIRHSHKLSYIPDEWKKSPRYDENNRDTPLSELGFKLAAAGAKELIKNSKDLRAGIIEVIYCSPFTRCIQTALEIVKEVKKSLGRDLTIIIVYDLGESILVPPTVYFNKNSINFCIPSTAVDRDDKPPVKSSIDKKMSPKALKARFPEISGFIVNQKSKSEFLPIETWEEESRRMFAAMKYIADKKESAIIVAHSHTIDLAYNYFNQLPKNKAIKTYSYTNETNVNTIVGFTRDLSKPGLSGYKMTYKPNSKFTGGSRALRYLG